MNFRTKVVEMLYTHLDNPHILTFLLQWHLSIKKNNIYQPQSQLSDSQRRLIDHVILRTGFWACQMKFARIWVWEFKYAV